MLKASLVTIQVEDHGISTISISENDASNSARNLVLKGF